MNETYRLSASLKRDISEWTAKFPKGRESSAVIMALRLLQKVEGVLEAKHLDAVAAYLKMPKIQVESVFRFYSMFYQQSVGKHVFKVCNSVSCYLKGSGQLLGHLQNKLSVDLDAVTPDGLFTVQETECLGACCQAPCMVVNDSDYHFDMTPDKINDLIDALRKQEV